MYRFLKASKILRLLSATPPLLMTLTMWCVAVSSAAEKHQHGAHVHGLGQLNVALDGEALLLEFTSPAANIIGFEHPPGNAQEKQAAKEATALLEAGEKLFKTTPEAQCSLQEAHIENSAMGEDHKENHTSEKHGEHHDDHHDEHAQEHAEGGVHSEYTGIYQFLCQTPAKLKNVDVQLFSQFPGLEELEVQLLSPKGQTAMELTPKMHEIAF